MSRFIAFVFLLVSASVSVAYAKVPKNDVLENVGGVTLAQLKADKALDNYYTVKFEDGDYFKSAILECEPEMCADTFDDGFDDVVLFAFTKWCNNFVGKEIHCDAYLLPFLNVLDKNLYVWSTKGEDYNCFKEKNSNICFDPYIEDVSLNESLLCGNIVLAVRKWVADGDATVKLDAVIPFEGNYYRYTNTLYFCEALKFDNLDTEDANAIKTSAGEAFPEYVDSEGWINGEFFDKYLRWCFDSMSGHEIQRVAIDLKTDSLTIKSVFYVK